MATYIPGVQSYLPNFKPFTPDYKFLSNVLDVQENRYNTNYKAVNDLYSKVVYGDLSRGDTQQMRSQYAENLAPKLQQISGMDLSSMQNTEAAKAIFKPFFEDDLIVRDLVFTKQYKDEMSTANAMQNSPSDEIREQYWSTGVEKLRYEMEDFVNASEKEALTMRAPTYTPDADLYQTALKYLKDAGLDDVVIDEPSKDGMWKITRTNGDLVTGQALQMVQKALKDDPRVVNAFHADAFVKSRRFAQQGMEEGKFQTIKQGQTAWATEQIDRMEILMSAKVQNKEQQLALQKDVVVSWQNYENEFGIIEGTNEAKEKREQESNQTALEMSIEAYKKSLADDRGVNTKGVDAPGEIQESPNLQALMNRAYGLLMNYNMEKDLQAAAVSYSNIGKKIELDENQFALNKQNYEYKKALENQRARNERDLEIFKDKIERAQLIDANPVSAMLNKLNVKRGEPGTASAETNDDGELVEGTDVVQMNLDAMLNLRNENINKKTKLAVEVFETIHGNKGNLNLGPEYDNVSGSSERILQYFQRKPTKARKFFDEVQTLISGGNPQLGTLNGGIAPDYVAKNTQNGRLEGATKAMFELAANGVKLDAIEKGWGENAFNNLNKAIEVGLLDLEENANLQTYAAQGISIFEEDALGNKRVLSKENFIEKFINHVNTKGPIKDWEGEDINEVSLMDRFTEGIMSGFSANPLAYKVLIKDEYNENVEENAEAVYDAQKKLLNSTLNATWRNNSEVKNNKTGETINTTDMFNLYDVNQANQGVPTSRMTVGDLKSNPLYSVIVDPMNPTSDGIDMLRALVIQEKDGTENYMFAGDMVSEGGKQNSLFHDDNRDIIEEAVDESGAKATALFNAFINDISRLQQKGATKSDYPTAKIEYVPHISGDSEDVSSGPMSFGAYQITFDPDWIVKQVGTNKLLGAVDIEEYKSISLVFSKESDLSDKRFGQINESYVASTITTSSDNTFEYSVPRGGKVYVTRNANGQYIAQVETVQWDANKNENVVAGRMEPVVIGSSQDRRKIDESVQNLIRGLYVNSGTNFTSEMSVKNTNINK